MMSHLNTQQKNQLRQQLKQVEQQTDGELVTVITSACDHYHFITMSWAAMITLLTPLFLHFTWWGDIGFFALFNVQVLVFCLLWLVFEFTPIKRWLVPKSLMRQRARRMAHELFFMQKLHYKSQRNAIMLFVAVSERYVEILADKEIDQKVDDAQWQKVINDFIGNVRAKKIYQGYSQAIESCGELLIEHFPISSLSKDELPNHLIEINTHNNMFN